MKGILGVAIPRRRVCSDHAAPFDAFADAYFAADSMAVWEASRGFGGKSFLLALLGLTEQITLGAEVGILGGSAQQSQYVHDYLTGFWDAPLAPRFLLENDPTKKKTVLTNGGQAKALTASQNSVRGLHPHRLRMDEIDEMKPAILDAALGQTMQKGSDVQPQTVLSSTHQHPDGTMTEVKKRAADSGWPVYTWCYRECLEPHGWLPQAEVERKRREVPAVMWTSEYELQEPSPESRAIDPEAVDAAFDAGLGQWTGEERGGFRLIGPEEGGPFYHGTDWAKEQDWTVLVTFEARTEEPDLLAAFERTGRKPWPLMIGKHNDRVRDYGGPSAHDATGVGDVCADYLEVDSKGFDFRRAKDRAEMLSTYIADLEDGQIQFPMVDWVYREHKFASYDDLYGSGHLPDSIAACALAWWAKRKGRGMKARDMILKY